MVEFCVFAVTGGWGETVQGNASDYFVALVGRRVDEEVTNNRTQEDRLLSLAHNVMYTKRKETAKQREFFFFCSHDGIKPRERKKKAPSNKENLAFSSCPSDHVEEQEPSSLGGIGDRCVLCMSPGLFGSVHDCV